MIRYDTEERKTLAAAALIKANANQLAKNARLAKVKPTAKGQREPQQKDKGFRAFIRRCPCAVAHMGGCSGPIEAAHLRFSNIAAGRTNPGMQRKSHDKFCNPLCHGHHQHDQHLTAERLFWERAGIDPDDLSAALYAAYQAGEPGEPIVRQFAAEARKARTS